MTARDAFEILLYPDPRLKQPAEPVASYDDLLVRFVEQLEVTMRAGPGAVGIAAPQVGRSLQVAIVDVSDARQAKKQRTQGRMVLVNPEIVAWEGMAIGREGCLSVPAFTGNVIRAERVTLRAHDEHGQRRELELGGFEARAVQHEVDHLDGLLFLDRLVSRRSDLFQRRSSAPAAE